MFFPFGIFTQILIGIVVALGFLNTGSSLTFPSIISTDADSNSTNLYGYPFTLSSTEKDMTGSLFGIGAIVGTILISTVSNIWGRKVAMFCNGFIGFLSWWAIALSPTTTGILIARTCSGISNGGVCVVCMNYVSETADVKVRGILCSLNSAFVAIGCLWTILLGYWFKYYTVCFINSVFPLGLTMGQLFLPESPKYLAIIGNIEAAKKALRIIRNSDEQQIEKEINQYIEMNKSQKSTKDIWKELLQFKMIKRLMVVGVLFMTRSFGGNEVLTINATRIFSMLGGAENAELYSIVLFLFGISSILTSSFFLIDRIGRKKSMYLSLSVGLFGVSLLTICSFFVATPEASISAYKTINNMVETNIVNLSNSTKNFDLSVPQEKLFENIQETNDLLPMVYNSTHPEGSQNNDYNGILILVSRFSIILAVFGFNLGVAAVPLVVNSEYFPTWLRAQTSSLGIICFMLTQFLSLQTFTPLVNLLSLGGYFLCSAVFLFLCLPFVRYSLEETMKKEVG